MQLRTLMQIPARTVSDRSADDRVSPWVLAAALLIGALLRVHLALTDDGIHWPDEVFQSLEPAHKLAFGYGFTAWEYLKGARSWALPGLIAGVMKLASAFGLDTAEGYLGAVRVVFCGIGVFTALGVYRLARTLGAAGMPAAVGATLFSLMGIAIYFAPRAMSETASGLLLVYAFALLLDQEGRLRSLVVGASLLGFAVFLRLQTGYFCLAVLAILLAHGRRQDAFVVLMVLALWAFLFGLFDRLTWGRWFHSAIEYLNFNVIEGKSGSFGRAPFWHYFKTMWSSSGVLSLLLLVLPLFAIGRVLGLWLTVALFVLVHSFILHKELRFLLPTLPLLCAMAAAGVDNLMRRMASSVGRISALVAVLFAMLSAAGYRDLTFGRLGIYEENRRVLSALDWNGAENRLLALAGRRLDVCGVKLLEKDTVETGGYSYFHKRAPVYASNGPAIESKHFNYVIGPPSAALGEAVAIDKGIALIRLPVDTCVPDPNYAWRVY